MGKIFAQPVAGFTVNKTQGCAPINIFCTNTTTNCTGGITHSWTIVGHPDISNNQDAVFNFTTGGNYTIILQETCSEGTSTFSIVITIFDSPIAKFSDVEIHECAPYDANFIDLSTPGDAAINEWTWYFDDGLTSEDQNPSHNYSAGGIYTVSLLVMDENGCTSQQTHDNLLRLAIKPVVSFVADNPTMCVAPHTVIFTSIVTTSFGISADYSWDFGDGSGLSTLPNPSHQYLAGVFDVALTVLDEYGCETVFQRDEYIRIAPAIPEYSVLEGNVVCKGMATHFVNETGYSCSWDFGDGGTSIQNTPVHIYNQTGPVTVTFTVDPSGLCEASTTFVLNVETVSASFTTNPTNLFSCTVPFEVSFTNTSSANASTFNYAFQDGGTATTQNSSHIYNTSGMFQPTLTVTSDAGCIHTFLGPIVNIAVPNATIIADPIEGCEQLTVDFTSAGTSTITNYNWNFGNGQNSENGSNVENSVYNAGDYTASLTVTDNNGCTAVSTVEIHVGVHYSPPTGVFDNDANHTPLPDHYLCAQDTISFWLPDFESEEYEYTWWVDSTSNQDPSQEYTDHAYDQDTGFVYLSIITDNNGCIDTTLKETFYISGPIIKSISSSYDCDFPREYEFVINTLLAERWDWKLYYFTGTTETILHQSLASTNENYSFTFPTTPDSFWVKLTAYNDTTNCEFVDSIQVLITSPLADFIIPQFDNCANDMINFDGSGSQNVSQYYWDFGDGTVLDWSNSANVNHTYTSVGTFTVTLKAKNSNDCEDQVSHQIHIIGPEIHVNISDNYGCNNLNVDFVSNSIADEAIISTHWSFGDGFNQSGTSVSHFYDHSGVYSVTVYVETLTGCNGEITFTDTITVAQVSSAYTTPLQAACVGQELTFNAIEANSGYTYTWNFGDGSLDEVGNDFIVTHSYASGGRYSVYLEVDNGFGCVSEMTIDNFITIQQPSADFSLGSSYLSCYPVEPVIIPNNSVIPSDIPLTYSWVFGTSEPILIENPTHLYTMPGEFEINLTLTTPAGCTSNHTETITIDGPYADAQISDTTACLGQEITFSIINMLDVDEFLWVVGGGDSYDLETFNHAYDMVPPAGFYPVNLILSSGSCDVTFVYNVYVFGLTAGLFISDTANNVILEGLCTPFEGVLTSNSINDDFREWYINGLPVGSGGSSESHLFENNGADDETLTISLRIEDVNGCVDSTSMTIDVYALPQITISADTSICKGDAITIYATGGIAYDWIPNLSISDDSIQSPIINPETDLTYFANVENAHGCRAADSVRITVFQDFDINLTPEIDSIVIGDTVYSVLVASEDNLTYSWSPQQFISCVDCPMPYFTPEESMRYTVTVEDSAQCFKYLYYIDIIVLEAYTLDVPGAFSPLSANENSIVYANGFGIRKLKEFRIFNRWGEEVFYTNDIKKGWDGYYNGQLQNIDNYSYYVEAEMFNGTIQSKKGHIMLIR